MKRSRLFSTSLFSVFLFPVLALSTTFSTAVLAADENANIPIEHVNSCKGLAEKDSCQIHGKTNALLNGICKTKALSQDDFELVCIADDIKKDPTADSDSAPLDMDSHKRKHKGH